MRKRVSPAPKIDVKKSGGISVVQLATYTSPKVVEVKSQEWVSYGSDNNYFGYLQDRINGSPTNNAIVHGITQMIFGKGLDATDSQTKPLEFAKAKMLFDDDTVERLCSDLKAMGQCAIQVIYSIDKATILECNHFPIETLRSGKCNEDGEVETYYYAENWSEINRSKKPTPIPAFGFGSTNGEIRNLEEILYVKPYKTGYYYYSPVDYQGGLQYCELEEEISNYHLNNIMNGLAPSMLINFNNGTPTEDEQRDIERNIQQKFGGSSNAGRFILSFNDSTQYNATITPVQLSDAHNQYEFLSSESMKKIMVSHRVISPMLLGIKDQTGLGNNAEELKTASILMDNTVIRPFQNLLIKNFDRVLAYNGSQLDLYFKTLQPLEFNDLTNALDVATIEEETGIKQEVQSKLSTLKIDLSEYGEVIDLDVYELIDERVVDYEKEAQLDAELSVHLAKTSSGTAYGNASSREDSPIYKVRYRYDGKKPAERAFCSKMLSDGKVYRKEDIEKMSQNNVNPGFGMHPNPDEPYDIFLWKGGGKLSEAYPFGTCRHFWVRETYATKDRKGKVDVYSPTAEIVSPTKSIAENGFIPKINDPKAYIAPHDM